MGDLYTKLVGAKCARNPCLSNLYKFLSSTDNSPYKSRIVSLEFRAGVSGLAQREIEPLTLANELSNTSDLSGKILVVENISRDMMELLGARLALDPLFFASHIHSAWREFEAQAPKFCELPSQTKRQNWAVFPYHRSLLFPDIDPGDYKLLRESNIRRKVIVFPPIHGKRVGIAQHCCSVLMVPRTDRGWLGLVLVDPPINNEYISFRGDHRMVIQTACKPLLGGTESFLPIDCSDNTDVPTIRSMLEELLHYWKSAQLEDFDPANLTLRSLSYYPLRVVAAEWVSYMAVMCFSLRQYDYQPSATAASAQDLNRINAALRTMPSWPRRVASSTLSLNRVLCFIKHHGALEKALESWDLLLEDYEHILSEIIEYGKRLEATIPLLTAYLQLAESRRAYSETRNVLRLTILALVFVPLSFVCSLLSMNEDYLPGGPYFPLFFAIAVPLLLAVFLIARFPHSLPSISFIQSKFSSIFCGK